MTTPIIRHSDASEIIGSWPIIPPLSVIGAPGIIRPGTVLNSATLLGMRRETSAGFLVVNKQFEIYIDNEDVPVLTTIGPFTDPGPGYLTLDQVVTQIKGQVADLASNDNGFLRLTSPTSGDGSYLRLETDILFPDTLQELGLFPGLVSRAGELAPAGHPDPVRSVSMPGQMLLTQGESFSSDAINRSLFQLSVNSDRTEGLVNRKRIATQKKVQDTYSGPVSGEEGYQFSAGEMVYIGREEDWAAIPPTRGELAKNFVVLDSDNRELIKENVDVLDSDPGVATTSPDSETGKQVFTSTNITFAAGDVGSDRYVLIASGAGVPAALLSVPLKISEFIDSNNVVIDPIDPVTGDNLTFTAGPIAAEKVRIVTARCWVEEVYDVPTGTRVEGQEVSKFGPTAPTRVEKNNRVVFSGAGLTTLGFPISVGDRVEWTGHLVTAPWSNNGEFRVKEVIDDETIELIGIDGEPVYLNPDLTTAAPGTLEVTTDGQFYEQPFLKFRDPPDGAIPEVGQTINILYMGASYLRDALDDPAVLSPDGVRFQQEVDDTVQRTLLAIIGPSVETIDDYLHDDRRNNLEDLDYRLNHEHYTHDEEHPDPTAFPGEKHAGRHRDIRPDKIDMFPHIPGATVTIRADPDDTTGVVKAQLRDPADVSVWQVVANGRMFIRRGDAPTTTYTRYSAHRIDLYNDQSLDAGLFVSNDGPAGSSPTYVSADADDNNVILRALAGSGGGGAGDREAQLLLDGQGGTGSKARATLKGTSNYSVTTPASDGAAVLHFVGDSTSGNPPEIALALKPGASPLPIFSFDWENNGAGLTTMGFRMMADGSSVFGDTLETPTPTIPITAHSRNASYTVASTTTSPQILAIGDDGDSGFQWVSDSDNFRPGEAAFLSVFPYADTGGTGGNNEYNWGAFEHRTKDPSVTRFRVNKHGQVLCAVDDVDTATDFTNFPSSLRSNVGAWVNEGLLVGRLSTWDGFVDSGYSQMAHFWLMGGSSMGADAGPVGFIQGAPAYHRFAQVYNCWLDNIAGEWRYVTDQDYAVRIRHAGPNVGAGVWGWTDWAAAAPSTAAGGTISTEGGVGNWIHSLIWDHETGFIGVGPGGSLPTQLLHLYNGKDAGTEWAVARIETGTSTGAGLAALSIKTSSTVQDPVVHFQGPGSTFQLGIDDSVDAFRLQPDLAFDSQFNSVAGSAGIHMKLTGTYKGNVGVNNLPTDLYDVRIGSQGSTGSLLVDGYTRIQAQLQVTGSAANAILCSGGGDFAAGLEAGGAIHTSAGAISTDNGNINSSLGSIYTLQGAIYTNEGNIWATDGNIEVRHQDHAFICDHASGYQFEDTEEFLVCVAGANAIEGGDYEYTSPPTESITFGKWGSYLNSSNHLYDNGYFRANKWQDGVYYGGMCTLSVPWPVSGDHPSYTETTNMKLQARLIGYRVHIQKYGADNSRTTRIRIRLLRKDFNSFTWTTLEEDVVQNSIVGSTTTSSFIVTHDFNHLASYALCISHEANQTGWAPAASTDAYSPNEIMFRFAGAEFTFETQGIRNGFSI